MRGRFFFFLTTLSLTACAGGGGGYTRSPVITPQMLDCGPAGPASVKVWSPAEVDLTFQGRTATLSRGRSVKGAYYKGHGMEYASHGAFALIRADGATYRCDVRPRDLEPEYEAPPALPAPPVERLDVTPYL